MKRHCPGVECQQPPAEEASREPDFIERFEQPVGSRVILKQLHNGIVLVVPRIGLFREPTSFVFGTLVWMIPVLFFSFLALDLTLELGVLARKRDALTPVGLSFLYLWLLFGWGVGLAMLRCVLVWLLRATVLSVRDGRLQILRKGVFGSKCWDWPREKVLDVCPGSTSCEVNDVPLVDLKVVLQDEAPVRLLAAHDHLDLEWLCPGGETGCTAAAGLGWRRA